MKGNKLIQGGEILLFGTIMRDRWIWPEDEGLFSSVMVNQALGQFNNGPVTLRVNCDGGDPFEGEAIRAAIADYPGEVTIKIQGAAHSAASLMILSADQIEMSLGSVMLVHDPSTGAYGNPAEIKATLEDLEALAEVYASVYAMRTGKTQAQAREIMRKGISFSASQAVEEGFVDQVSGDGETGAELPASEMHQKAQIAMMQAAGRVRAAQMKFDAAKASDSNSASGAATGADAPLSNGEPQMVKKNPKTGAQTGAPVNDPAATTMAGGGQGTAPAGTAGASAPDDGGQAAAASGADGVPAEGQTGAVMQASQTTVASEVAAALAADRARGAEIREMAAPFAMHMEPGAIDDLVNKGSTVDQARAVVMAAAASHQPQTRRVQITRDETDTRMEGMIGALMHQANPGAYALEGPAESYRGLRLKSLAMQLSGGGFGYDEMSAIRRGMISTSMTGGAHGVSDFAYITGEVLNRTLRAAYKRRPQSWLKLSRRRTATDFRALHSVNFGGDLEFKKVDENGEYQRAVLQDEATKLAVEQYGRDLAITLKAVINDDMGVFERLPGDFAMRASTLESKVMWKLIRDNAEINGTALFHADHKNLGGTGGITVTNVAKGRKAMWEQRPVGSKDKDDFIEVVPDLIYAPPALETSMLQFVAEAVPTKMADANPFSKTLTPVTEARLGAAAGGSDTHWYLFSSDLPPLEHAYLDGYEAPSVVINEGMNPDVIKMTARHIFGGAAAEFRGSYRHG